MQIFRYIFLCIVVLLSMGFNLHADEAEKRIGVVIPLTGAVASVGESVRNAMLLAHERYQGEGNYRFIFEDNAYEVSNTVSAVRKLINIDSVEGLVVFGSGPALAVGELVESSKIPSIAISTAEDTTRDRHYWFRHWLDSAREANIIFDEAERRDIKNFAVVTTTNDGLLPIRDTFISLAGKDRVVLDVELDAQDFDLRPVTLRIRNARPAGVLLNTVPPQTGTLARRLRESGYEGEIFSVHTIDADAELGKPGGSLEGVWYATSDEREAEWFFKAYTERFGIDALVAATNGYDIAMLMMQALETNDAVKYMQEVEDFSGALGNYGTVGGRSFDVPGTIKIVSEGKLVYLE